jgi:H+/Cl- antiporter ClcA
MTPTKGGNEPAKEAVHGYADNWIMERSGTEVPAFLKFAFIAIAAGCIAYFIIYMYGEVNHPDRGVLVKAMNAATEASATLMYIIVAMIVAYGVIVVAFSFRKSHKD